MIEELVARVSFPDMEKEKVEWKDLVEGKKRGRPGPHPDSSRVWQIPRQGGDFATHGEIPCHT